MSRAPRHWLLAGLLLFAACATEETELSRRVRGMRAREAAEISDPAKSRLELALADGARSWCPSAVKPAQLRAIVHTPDADMFTPVRLRTAVPGYLPQTAVAVTITGATLGPEWILTGPSQPAALLSLLEKPVSIAGHVSQHPTVSSTLELKTTFDCDQGADFPGRPGRDGGKGGMRGENGEDGLDVVVALSYLRPSAGQKLVLAKATPSMGVPVYFLLAPGRRLGINARGGDGGKGGDATVGIVRLSGGLGGDGGNGGRVLVRIDPHHPELRAMVSVVNPAGQGGLGGSNDDSEGSRASAGRPGRSGPPVRFENAEPEKMFKDEIEAGVPVLGSGPSSQI
jgi:hypothetical protein